MKLTAINPATGEIIKEYDAHTPEQVNAFIETAHLAFGQWKQTSFEERAMKMRRAAEILRERKLDLAELIALEMGKPLKGGIAEVEKCADTCVYYADHAGRHLAPEPVETEASRSLVSFQPVGVVLAVMPWNFPLWQAFRFLAPALMAGNAAVLKHASNVPGCALAIGEVLQEAGFPEGLFRTLLVGSREVNDLIAHPLVRAVTLTGSTGAGKAVAAKAGEMLKKTVLELGGSDAYVVLEDADLELAVTTCVSSRLINSGQSCIAAKRFIVVEAVKEAFEQEFVKQMQVKKMGDPLDESVEIGPQAREDLRDELHQQVLKSIEAGARCLLGGEMPEGRGAFYPPTVLTDVTKGMAAFDEETFGPVAAIISAKDEQEAIQLANDSVFGLGAAVFTQDLKRGEQIAETKLEAGACFVNALVKSDPRLPFGGIKASGYGRELSHYGIKEFVNIKTVYVK